jgi:hypothetical protein
MSAQDDLIAALEAFLASRGGTTGGTTTTTPTRDPLETDEKYEERRLKALQRREEELKKEGDRLKEIEKSNIRLRDLEEKKLELEKKRLQLKRELGEINDAQLAAGLLALQKQSAGIQSGTDAAKRFLGVTDQQNSLLTQMAVGGEEFFKGFGKGLTRALDPMNVLSSTIDKVVEMTVFLALEQDKAIVSFNKATGASGEFDSTIQNLERSLFTTGVSAAEAGQSVQTLFLNVSDFTEMSGSQQEELAKTTAVLNELGVNADNTAKNLQFATRALGMTTTEATRLQRELFTFAQDLGVSADKIAQDFQKFGPQIAALGSEGVDAFKQLEMQAKATGFAIEELVNITEQFNKFDTAAQAVGKLNAMLGGPFLNTLEMVNETNPAKRMELLKNAVDRAGLSFDDMDFYQRKAIASSMGLNEQQLALLMRGEFNVGPPPKTAEELADLAKQTAQFNDVMEELTQIARGLAISFGPVISMFKNFLQLLSPIAENLDFVAYGLGGYAVATAAASLATSGFTLALAKNLLFGGLAIFLPLLGMLPEKLQTVAKVIAVVTGVVIALGFALDKQGTALAATITFAGPAAVAMSGLATAEGAAAAASGPAAAGLGSLAAAGTAAIPVMLALGAAVLGIGLGIGATIASVAMLINSISTLTTGLGDSMTATALAISEIVQSINELNTVKAIAFTAAMGPLAAVAMSPVGLAATAVAAAAGPNTGEAAPAAAAGAGGPPPVININLSIDGSEFATVVNSVEVSRHNNGNQSTMYNSIIGMIEQGFAKG